LGVAQLQGGHTDAALSALRRARSHAPEDENVRLNLANVLIQAGRFAEAEALLRQPLPQRADLLALRGLALRGLGRLPEALKAFEAAVQRAPRDTNVLNNYGVLLEENGDPAAAIDTWRRVLEIEPANRFARENLEARGAAPGGPAQKE
jgi:Tfp pilus assembly protein PilF